MESGLQEKIDSSNGVHYNRVRDGSKKKTVTQSYEVLKFAQQVQ